MATLPRVDVVFVGFGLTCSVVANELSKRATNLQMVGLERGPFRDTFPDFLQDHFDVFRYAVQSQLFQDLNRVTITFRNNRDQTALPMVSVPVRPAGVDLRTSSPRPADVVTAARSSVPSARTEPSALAVPPTRIVPSSEPPTRSMITRTGIVSVPFVMSTR